MTKRVLLIWLISFPVLLLAQKQVDTLLDLPAVLIHGSTIKDYQVAKEIVEVDSTYRAAQSLQAISEVLGNEGLIYIKNYGPGQAATSSIRGGSAQHTAIVWKGLNLQSPMLGLYDLSLIPADLFENIKVQYGGNSALLGSGAIGGAIHLQNDFKQKEEWDIHLKSGLATYSDFKQSAHLNYQNKHFNSINKVFYQNAANDFAYLDQNGQSTRRTNNHLNTFSLLSEQAIIVNRHQLDVNLWYQQSKRELPAPIGQLISTALQHDESTRMVIDYGFHSNNWKQSIKLAVVNENINYLDDRTGIISDASSGTFLANTNFEKEFNSNTKWKIGLLNKSITAKSTTYLQQQKQNETAVFSSLSTVLGKLHSSINLRQAQFDGQLIPFTGSIDLLFRLNKQIKIKLDAGRMYRIPTFNELYWNENGARGNSDLIPEEGWQQSIGLNWQSEKEHYQMEGALNAFNKNVSNWILWQTQNGLLQPHNIAEVWSRGVEGKMMLSGAFKKLNGLKSKVLLSYGLTKATNQKATFPNDNAIGKQLVYLPVHRFTFQAHFNYKRWTIYGSSIYNGQVYTAPDHSASLPHYWVHNTGISHRLQIKKLKIHTSFNIYNQFNNAYQVVLGRPMPGRRYEINFHFNL